MHNKTILHITGAQSTKYGSFEKYLLELGKLCNNNGYKTILQYESLPHSREYLSDLKKNNIKVNITPINTKSILSTLTLTKMIKNISPEIIQTHFINGFSLLVYPIITKMFRIPKIYHMQHLDSGYKRIPFIKLLFNNYNNIFCISKIIADDLIKAGVNKNIVIVNNLGIFGEYTKSEKSNIQLRKEFNIPAEATVISCIAFDHPVKGVDILLKAFKKVLEHDLEIHLLIIGIKQEKSKMYELSKKLGLSKNVHWAGIRDNAIETLNISDIYVQPSRKEGLGLAIIEAMALGIPIVATNTGGIPEVVTNGKTGYVVKPEDPDALAHAIKDMLSDKELMKKLGENGKKRYQETFKGEKSIKKIVNHYDLS